MRYAKAALASVPATGGTVSPGAPFRRRAFDLAVDGAIADAADQLSGAAAAVTDQREAGWLLEQRATYLDQIDPEEAQRVLAAARAKNSSVLRPLSGITYKTLSGSTAQSTMCTDYLVGRYGTDGNALRVGFEAVLDGLRFDPDATDAFEQAMRDLGLHLGFAAERPENELGQGPDVLWALGDLKYWVIEAKSGAKAQFIGKRDINQLSGSVNWFYKQYDNTTEATPVLVHPSVTLSRDASASPGSRVITKETLDGLRNAFRALGTALASSRWDSPDVANGLLRGHNLRGGDLQRYLKSIKDQ